MHSFVLQSVGAASESASHALFADVSHVLSVDSSSARDSATFLDSPTIGGSANGAGAASAVVGSAAPRWGDIRSEKAAIPGLGAAADTTRTCRGGASGRRAIRPSPIELNGSSIGTALPSGETAIAEVRLISVCAPVLIASVINATLPFGIGDAFSPSRIHVSSLLLVEQEICLFPEKALASSATEALAMVFGVY